MASLPPGTQAEGWYPDPQTGGAAYWDGRRWTGDLRPRRKPFAAKSSHRLSGIICTVLGGIILLSMMAILGNRAAYPTANPLAQLILGLGLLLIGIYLLRGRGPSTRSAAARAAKMRRESAAVVPVPVSDAVRTAQIEALSDPDTAQALQNLQHLLYTRVITEAEFEAAKNKLLGD